MCVGVCVRVCVCVYTQNLIKVREILGNHVYVYIVSTCFFKAAQYGSLSATHSMV